jgi:ubiquinone biosynthesis protein
MEKFPQIPQLVFNGLQQLQNIGDLAPELHKTAQQLQKRSNNSTRRYWIAATIFIGAIVCAQPDVNNFLQSYWKSLSFSAPSFILGAVGIGILLLKK